MEVLINQQSYHLPENSPLNAVLTALQIPSTKGLALAVNNKVIPKSRWEIHTLQPDDRVLLIKATQGG